MNQHFFNFIAAFNAAAKNRRWSFSLPVRNKFIIVFLDFLTRERLIESYFLPKGLPPFYPAGTGALGGARTSFCYPVEVTLRHEFIKSFYSFSTPGKYHFMSGRELARFADKKIGARGVVVVSSPRLGRLCNARELISIGEGGLVVGVIFIS